MSSTDDVRLAALDWAPLANKPSYLTTFPLGWEPRRLGISHQMRRWLEAEAASGAVDVIHNHGLWMMPNVYAGNARRKSSCKLIHSPHGAMSPFALSQNPIIKKIFWGLLQGAAARAADCFHATAENEYKDIRRLGFKQPVCIISCGVNLDPLMKKQDGGRRQLLFLGRIHPIKGVDNLLHAWHAIENKFSDWDLHITGPDEDGYLAEMQALAAKLQLQRVFFRGPLFGEDKKAAYSNASLYVLPTHSENFGITVAEALAAGVPAIVTKGAPWEGLEKYGAGWWIEIGVEPLVACLEQAIAQSDVKLASMGQAGREWMIRDYSWERIRTQFSITYRWMIDGGEPPSWVRLD
jgi:glycosyltransferase involved in cell wall biosynthesis